ncbi:MAG: hypothetical protein H0X51_06705 [Parachlamydiaceae bacterium]|nr:hypothetical protein [Parachlamydiaceae bacterium]
MSGDLIRSVTSTLPVMMPLQQPTVKRSHHYSHSCDLANIQKLQGAATPIFTGTASSVAPIKEPQEQPPKLLLNAQAIEQLTHLHTICQLRNLHTSASPQFTAFCYTSLRHNQNINGLLGKLIFLANRNLAKTLDLIDHRYIEKSIHNIESVFEAELSRIALQLHQTAQQHQVTGIQDSMRVVTARLPVEIAQLLITDAGLNHHIIPDLKAYFLAHPRYNNERELLHRLTLLENSSSLRQLLAHTNKPSSLASPANTLIRISLGMDQNAEISQMDAQRAALAALLSHLRQGEAGSCFASYLAINLLETNLEQCLKDFQELLHNNCLKRLVNGCSVEFTYLMRTSGEVLDRSLIIDRSGNLYTHNSRCSLADSPGIQAACQAIGITNSSQMLQMAAAKLFAGIPNAEAVQITVQQLLHQLVMQTDSSTGQPAKRLDQACLAYHAQIENPLQLMWSNTIAGMAEAEESSHLKQKLVSSVVTTLHGIPDGHHFDDSITNLMTAQLLYHTQMQYDPSHKYPHHSVDDHSTYGAFVLHHRESSTQWKRVDSPEAFQHFLVALIEEAFQYFPNLSQHMKKFTSYVRSSQFTESVLGHYSLTNARIPNLQSHLSQLKHTPWIDASGNTPKTIQRIYFSQTTDREAHHTVLHPKNASELLTHVSHLHQTSSTTRIPVSIRGVHACTLIPSHPSLANIHDAEWVQTNVITPGKMIADSVATEKTRQSLIQHMFAKLPHDKGEAFLGRIAQLPESLSVTDFRNALIQELKDVAPAEFTRYNSVFIRSIDTLLFNVALPPEQRKILAQSSLHFADSNWQHKAKDIHFCFVVNPGTGLLEVCEVLEDGSGLLALDQDKWVKRKWEI